MARLIGMRHARIARGNASIATNVRSISSSALNFDQREGGLELKAIVQAGDTFVQVSS